ncbi:globin domain-containing protein [Amaricoccus sp.]|uniref:globin domain-containing protein n=1 Tax=Amaricoccus sp. TaxID=1872485 RepID=UPI001B6D2A5F|nr:globin domain-containing protein [Amaricoccus sp.]MBP7000562.1 hemin receptor [Amaricoccus sp.]
MAIGPDDVARVRASLPLIRERFEPASSRFYDNLFAIAPEMRLLFRGDMDDQGMRFMSTLVAIADMIDDPDALAAEVAGLAVAHARIGIRAEHFPPLGHALLVTLGETLGSAFTPELQSAWRAAYAAIAEAMARQGARASA